MYKPVRVIVPTCDKYLWACRPFLYLLGIYWSELQPVLIGGYTKPNWELLPATQFRSLRKSYPVAEWTDGLIDLFRSIDDDIFVWMLEDYWLNRGVNHQAVESLAEYMRIHQEVLRIDLTTDRLYSGRAVDVDTWGYLDIIETPPDAPYQFSTQACLMNRANLLRCLRPGVSPWDFELHGNAMILDGLRVLGTRQSPVRYTNGIGMGIKTKYNVVGIESRHVKHMRSMGILPENEPL